MTRQHLVQRSAPRRTRGGFARCVGTAASLVALCPAALPAQTSQPQINAKGLTPSAVCGQCHQAIYDVWKHSLHSKSWTNAVFQAGYRRAVEAHGAEPARLCLSCHAPTVRVTNDYAVKEPLTAEGVTCDLCHSVHSVDLSDPVDTLRLDPGMTKYGPMRRAQSPVHETKTSSLHTRSEFCAACHEYRNAEGVLVLSTYSEWKSSAYAKQGKQCQDCHMPLVPGRVVPPGVKSDTQLSINLHNISGSHDQERVRNAVLLKLVRVDHSEDRLWIRLEVTNAGSGHCFPTGLPMHRARLVVTLTHRNGEIARQEERFEVVMLDKEGRVLEREHEVFIKAAEIRRDTRLRPGETRPMTFHFAKVNPADVDVNASLFYEYSTESIVIRQKEERIEPVRMKFLIASVTRKATW